MSTEELAAYTELHIHTFPILQHVCKVCVQVRLWDRDYNRAYIFRVRLFDDCQNTPDREAVIIDRQQFLQLGLLNKLSPAPETQSELDLRITCWPTAETQEHGHVGSFVLLLPPIRVDPDLPVIAADPELARANELAGTHTL